MKTLIGQRALVIGAGMGGLSAAGALAPYFRQVVVLERDALSSFANARPGVPQGRHSHGLLAGGLRALDGIFPRYRRDLVNAGAVSVEVAREVGYERPDVGALPQRDLGISLLFATRPLIEGVLRRQVETIGNVDIRRGCRVTEILRAAPDAAGRRLRFDTASGASETLDADLVIDASGRGALTLSLLDMLGRERPEVTEIGVDVTYTTAVVEIPPPGPRNWKVAVTFPDPPRLATYGLLIPIEGDRWMVTVSQRGAAERLDSWDKYLTALRGLNTPTIFNALRHARPVEDIRHFAFPTSSWRHFERLPRLPRGVLPMADAVCRFNPIYGQGMSSAALQARLLGYILERSAAASDPIAAVQAGFMAQVASVLETPWGMSTSGDLVFPDTRGVRPENFEDSRRFEAALFRAVVVDPVVHKALMDVGQLLQPGSLLHEPHIKQRIEAAQTAAPVMSDVST